jgi:hypothetical protein
MSSNQRKQWKDTVPDQLKPVGNLEGDLNFREMIHDKSVIVGFVAAILGIVVAFISYQFCTGNIQTLLAFAAAALAFTGTGQITKYINDKTVAGVQNQQTKQK